MLFRGFAIQLENIFPLHNLMDSADEFPFPDPFFTGHTEERHMITVITHTVSILVVQVDCRDPICELAHDKLHGSRVEFADNATHLVQFSGTLLQEPFDVGYAQTVHLLVVSVPLTLSC